MAEPHVISALVAKYRRLLGRLEACEAEGDELTASLIHLREAIHLFQPGYKIHLIRPIKTYRRDPRFKAGQRIRAALDVLRAASEPLTSHEIATRIYEGHFPAEKSPHAIEALRSALDVTLGRYEQRAIVRGDGQPKRWALP